MRRFAAVSLAFGLVWSAIPALAAEPARLVSVDPLTQPAPNLLEPMRFAPDSRLPSEKIHPMLWEEAVKRGPDAQIPIIVTLREPLLPQHLRGTTAEADAHRIQWVSSLAHQFAPRAHVAGMKSLRALSHFPIVFGNASSKDVVQVSRLPQVRSIELDGQVFAFRSEGGALMRSATLRNSFGASGAGVEVAVIDSGVFPHDEFASRIRAHGDFTGEGNFGTIDGIGHGTSVAGIIAGSSGGMAPLAGLWAMKVFLTSGGSAQDSWIQDALDSAYANRNAFGGLDIINMSLGGGFFSSDCDGLVSYGTVINQIVAAGIPVFAASGNDGFFDGVSRPACLSTVIAVGAVYDATLGAQNWGPPAECSDPSPNADEITCYSNSGEPLDILAPSHNSHTTAPNNGYDPTFGGTSAAAPYAAGVAAQILSVLPLTTPAQLRFAFMNTGEPLTDVNDITRNRIDAVEAYQSLAGSGGGPCTEGPNTACLLNDRFKVEVEWTNFEHVTRDAFVASAGTSDSALFYWENPVNWELLIKAINVCVPPFNSYWIYFAAATNVGYQVTVTDTVAGGPPNVYTNPLGNLAQATNDSAAFPCP